MHATRVKASYSVCSFLIVSVIMYSWSFWGSNLEMGFFGQRKLLKKVGSVYSIERYFRCHSNQKLVAIIEFSVIATKLSCYHQIICDSNKTRKLSYDTTLFWSQNTILRIVIYFSTNNKFLMNFLCQNPARIPPELACFLKLNFSPNTGAKPGIVSSSPDLGVG